MTNPALESTVEITQSSPGDSLARGRRVELVAGTGPRMSAEIRGLLAQRLKTVSLVTSCIFALFLLRQSIVSEFVDAGMISVYRVEIGVMLVLAVVTALVHAHWNWSLVQLRWLELFTFAPPAAFLAYLQWTSLRVNAANALRTADAGSHWEARSWSMYNLMICVAFWLSLIFVYSTFIPNRWRRAAAMVGAMGAAPVAILFFQFFTVPGADSLIDASLCAMITLMMGSISTVAIIGTYIMGSLRQEAFQARQLGQYRLKQLLGAGGMGEVYLAEHLLLKRPCAIKLIRPGKQADARALARFEREVRATAELSHWNTVDVYDYGRTDDGTLYYVMEYLPGMSLAEMVRRHGPLPAARVIYLLRQTCQALAEAHAVGLIHRDIKPGNIIACRRGGQDDVAKLLDFGLVKPLSTVGPELSQDGTVTGSPLYMSPEQALADREPDARSDIYSLGAVAYFLLTGKPPFESRQPLQVLVAHARDPVTPPTAHRPDVPADLEQVVLRALAKQPEDRFASALEMDRALAACAAAGQWTHADALAWWQARTADQPALV